MLPPEHRLRRSADFTDVVRRGRRASRPTLTVHLLLDEDRAPSRAGLVVSKAVGGSVVRHRTSRRLRHLLRAHVVPGAGTTPAPDATGTGLPAGSRLVVRAAPRAATATSAELAADLAAALSSAVSRSVGRPVRS
jgi:ribonuclease P protein component